VLHRPRKHVHLTTKEKRRLREARLEMHKRLVTDMNRLQHRVKRHFRSFYSSFLASPVHTATRVYRQCLLLDERFNFPPSMCESVRYLLQVNYVGQNVFGHPRTYREFIHILQNFLQHTQRHPPTLYRATNRRIARTHSTAVISVRFFIKLAPSTFDIVQFQTELVEVLANVLRVPAHRIRVNSISTVGRVGVTFQILPSGRRHHRRHHRHRAAHLAPATVDALAARFIMSAQSPSSKLRRSPIFRKLDVGTLVVSKMYPHHRARRHFVRRRHHPRPVRPQPKHHRRRQHHRRRRHHPKRRTQPQPKPQPQPQPQSPPQPLPPAGPAGQAVDRFTTAALSTRNPTLSSTVSTPTLSSTVSTPTLSGDKQVAVADSRQSGGAQQTLSVAGSSSTTTSTATPLTVSSMLIASLALVLGLFML